MSKYNECNTLHADMNKCSTFRVPKINRYYLTQVQRDSVVSFDTKVYFGLQYSHSRHRIREK